MNQEEPRWTPKTMKSDAKNAGNIMQQAAALRWWHWRLVVPSVVTGHHKQRAPHSPAQRQAGSCGTALENEALQLDRALACLVAL
jgi:hypothetical protein